MPCGHRSQGEKMGKYLDKAKVLRNNPNVHYNCAQSIVAAFSELCGITDEQARRIGANFGSGMRTGSVCGAYTGVLMVLGLIGKDESSDVAKLTEFFRQNHQCLECKALLRASAERGEIKKDHCDGLVYEMVSYIEGLL